MSNFVKRVLIEQAELDRLQQRQLRDYSPELHSMSLLNNQINYIINKTNMTAEEKLNLLSTAQARFDKLNKDTGVLSSGGQSSPSSSTVDSQKAIASDANTDNDDDQHDEDIQPPAISPAAKTVRKLNVQPMFEAKARNLMLKIMDHPDILSRNTNGEIIVNGKAEPGTNFDTIFKSLVGRSHDVSQPGFDTFLKALHQLGIRKQEFSGQVVKTRYSRRSTLLGPEHSGRLPERRSTEDTNLDPKLDKKDTFIPSRRITRSSQAAAPSYKTTYQSGRA